VEAFAVPVFLATTVLRGACFWYDLAI